MKMKFISMKLPVKTIKEADQEAEKRFMSRTSLFKWLIEKLKGGKVK